MLHWESVIRTDVFIQLFLKRHGICIIFFTKQANFIDIILSHVLSILSVDDKMGARQALRDMSF